MPSFLSKVFSRTKRDDKSGRRNSADVSLLDGKFEAVSPNVSPSAAKFSDALNGNGHAKEKEKGKDKEPGFALLRSKSNTSEVTAAKISEVPHLSLHLPGPKGDSRSRALDVVFEADPESRILLAESAIGARRLNPVEALVLVRACSEAITARGLETLGIMHPHWYSASPDTQRKLISLFIQSLASNSSTATPSSAVSAFKSEVEYTRSPHDIAAILRWGLRHLQLEGTSFGKEDSWYKSFSESERTADFPPNAFSDKLVPLLPPAHLELLTATLDIFSSLAAHAEANSISGSKLSKLLGLWLLTSRRVEDKDDWTAFYSRWETMGRMLEHLFLSYIRNEAAAQKMPRRLLELVHQYPYGKDVTADGLLPRPRLSTRRYDALYVHISTEYSSSSPPRRHPRQLVEDAFKSIVSDDAHHELWETIKAAGFTDNQERLGAVFSDETIRFLSLIPSSQTSTDGDLKSPTFSLLAPEATMPSGVKREQSLSTSSSLPTAAPTEAIAIDWAQFSTSGFLETVPVAPLAETLMDKDIEVTIPRAPSKKLNKRTAPPHINTAPVGFENKTDEGKNLPSKTTKVSQVQIDEAFIDFWSDALLDPISAEWPAFVLCKLKSGVAADGGLKWVVIEQEFVRPPPPPVPVVVEDGAPKRPQSPRLSVRSEASSSARKARFSFFSAGSKNKKRTGKGLRVGEMGEVLAEEEDEGAAAKSKAKETKEVKEKSKAEEKKSEASVGAGAAVVGAAVATAGVAAVAAEAADAVSSPSADDSAPAVPIAEASPVGPTPVEAAAPVEPALEPPVTEVTSASEPISTQEPAPKEIPVEEATLTSEPVVLAEVVPLAEPLQSPAELLAPAPEVDSASSPENVSVPVIDAEPQPAVDESTQSVGVLSSPDLPPREPTPVPEQTSETDISEEVLPPPVIEVVVEEPAVPSRQGESQPALDENLSELPREETTAAEEVIAVFEEPAPTEVEATAVHVVPTVLGAVVIEPGAPAPEVLAPLATQPEEAPTAPAEEPPISTPEPFEPTPAPVVEEPSSGAAVSEDVTSEESIPEETSVAVPIESVPAEPTEDSVTVPFDSVSSVAKSQVDVPTSENSVPLEAALPPAHIEPLRSPTPDANEIVPIAPVPVVDVEPASAHSPAPASVEPVAPVEASPAPEVDHLPAPPGPESVISAGSTPGPAVALSTEDHPVDAPLAHIVEDATAPVPEAAPPVAPASPPSPETTPVADSKPEP